MLANLFLTCFKANQRESQFLADVIEGDTVSTANTLVLHPEVLRSTTFRSGKSALHLAAQQGHLHVLSSILEGVCCSASIPATSTHECDAPCSPATAQTDTDRDSPDFSCPEGPVDGDTANQRQQGEVSSASRPRLSLVQRVGQSLRFFRASLGADGTLHSLHGPPLPQSAAEVISELLNLQDAKGKTPLTLACANGHAECARFLLVNGADRFICDHRGNVPLHYASCKGNLGILYMLLTEFSTNGGEDLAGTANIRNAFGHAPLHFAAWGRQSASVQVLLQNGADISPLTVRVAMDLLPCPANSCPLHLAAARGHIEISRILLKTFVERVLEPSRFIAPGRGDALPPPDPRLIRNTLGQVPYQVSQQLGFFTLATLLRPSIPVSRLFSEAQMVHRTYGPPLLKILAAQALNAHLLASLERAETVDRGPRRPADKQDPQQPPPCSCPSHLPPPRGQHPDASLPLLSPQHHSAHPPEALLLSLLPSLTQSSGGIDGDPSLLLPQLLSDCNLAAGVAPQTGCSISRGTTSESLILDIGSSSAATGPNNSNTDEATADGHTSAAAVQLSDSFPTPAVPAPDEPTSVASVQLQPAALPPQTAAAALMLAKRSSAAFPSSHQVSFSGVGSAAAAAAAAATTASTAAATTASTAGAAGRQQWQQQQQQGEGEDGQQWQAAHEVLLRFSHQVTPSEGSASLTAHQPAADPPLVPSSQTAPRAALGASCDDTGGADGSELPHSRLSEASAVTTEATVSESPLAAVSDSVIHDADLAAAAEAAAGPSLWTDVASSSSQMPAVLVHRTRTNPLYGNFSRPASTHSLAEMCELPRLPSSELSTVPVTPSMGPQFPTFAAAAGAAAASADARANAHTSDAPARCVSRAPANAASQSAFAAAAGTAAGLAEVPAHTASNVSAVEHQPSVRLSHSGAGISRGSSAKLAAALVRGLSSRGSDVNECGVCLERSVGVCMAPCSHAMCGPCARSLITLNTSLPSLCPFCRTFITTFSACKRV
ncbi:MAG: hypothetical protein WDW38_011091 [Sanguina aurantia]